MKITQLDHLVLTVQDINQTINFYTKILSMTEITFGNNRKALQFGKQKSTCINKVKKFCLTPNTQCVAVLICAF